MSHNCISPTQFHTSLWHVSCVGPTCLRSQLFWKKKFYIRSKLYFSFYIYVPTILNSFFYSDERGGSKMRSLAMKNNYRPTWRISHLIRNESREYSHIIETCLAKIRKILERAGLLIIERTQERYTHFHKTIIIIIQTFVKFGRTMSIKLLKRLLTSRKVWWKAENN